MKEKILPLLRDRKNQGLLAVIVILGLISTGILESPKAQEPHEDVFTADTVIPRGFVLVPVEIQNIEALGSLIGAHAVVDLFSTAQLQQKAGIRVGKNLRLLRAPLNPQMFAVLVPESETHELLQMQGPYTAVIQNPDTQQPAKIMRPAHPVGSRVEYFKGEQHGH